MIIDELRQLRGRMTGSSVRKTIKLFRTPGVWAIVTYRFGHWLKTQPLYILIALKPIYYILNRRMTAGWGISIGAKAVIGRGFWIAHYGGIFIDETAIIGDDFTISHDVTIGKEGHGSRRGAPTIGNNVYIAPGAKVVGKIAIGNNVRIGANTVVNRDVPDNALVQTATPRVVVFKDYYGETSGQPQ